MQQQKEKADTPAIPSAFSDYTHVICSILSISPESITAVSPLGGMTNLNFRLDAGGKSYAVRLAGEWAQELIERRGEHLCTALAQRIGLHTDLVFFDPRTGLKICGYIENAEPLTPETLTQPAHMAMAAALLKRLHHCGESLPVEFDFAGKVVLYEKLLRRHQADFFPGYAELRANILSLRNQTDARCSHYVPCHNDPVPENFIKSSSQRIYLLDWEYGGMNDPLWDLAALSVECGWESAQEQAFLRLYLGREASPEEYRLFLISKLFPDFLWSLWGRLRAAKGGDGSPFDYHAYARMRYDRAWHNLRRLP